MSQYDVVIVGCGIVGMATALALAQKTSLRIALIDAKPIEPVWRADAMAQRVSAISMATQRFFQHIAVWQAMQEKRVSPYQKMFVWDEQGAGEIQFDSASIQSTVLGHIVEDNVMRSSLYEKIVLCSTIQVMAPLRLIAVRERSDYITVEAEGGLLLQASLLIAADGAHSWVREQVGIAVYEKDYQHTAIVAQVKTELPHQATAWQHFTVQGPLAFLPLSDAHTCSIVWSVHPDEAERLLALDDEAFKQALSLAFSSKLGLVQDLGKRSYFPLRLSHAKQYVKSRVALIGDAAHTIHPLAGQGVNLGLLDAASLVDVLVAAHTNKKDIGAYHGLRPYERSRKSDNLVMLFAVSGIKQLFASSSKPVRRVCGFGLNAVNHFSRLKEFITQYAVGNRSDLPSLSKPAIKPVNL